MGASDFLASVLILSAAVYLLYRSVWKNQGACHGCASGGCRRPPPREPAELVRLGQPRRPAAGEDAPPRTDA